MLYFVAAHLKIAYIKFKLAESKWIFSILQNNLKVQDENILIAGLLHDTLEDTETTYEELVENFSKEVADIVQEVSHPKNYN